MIKHIFGVICEKIKHPVLLLSVVTAAIVDTYYAFLRGYDATPDIMAFMVYTGLCLAIPIFPRFAGCTVIVWFLLCTILPQLDTGPMLIGVCVAFATVFALLNAPTGLILIGISITELCVSSNVDAAVAMMIVQAMSALLGYISKRHLVFVRQREELIAAKQTVSVLSRDLAIAAHLHDTVTNDLSYVITIAATRGYDAIDEEETRTLDMIIERSQDAFAKTHEVIDQLTVAKPFREAPVFTISLKQELESETQKEKIRLNQLGLTGDVIVNGRDSCPVLSSQIHAEITGLVSEIFANLRRHCAPSADYTVIINIRDNTFILTAMNTLNDKTMSVSRTSGKGLRLHQSIITSIGGKLTFYDDHGTWTTHAVIPLSPHQSA